MTTVSGYIRNAQGTPLPSKKVVFTPLNTPAIEVADLRYVVASNSITAITANTGFFTVDLKKGDYRVTIDDQDIFSIAVISDSGSVSIGSIVRENLFYIPVNVAEAQDTYVPIINGTISGAIGNGNRDYTVQYNYVAGSLAVYLNGQRLRPGADNDYVEVSNNLFRMNDAPLTGDVLLVDYRK